MKTRLLALFLVIASSIATLAQPDAINSGGFGRAIKPFLIRIYPLTGKPIDGIFYALTDSSILFCARTKATVDSIKQGYVPRLDTLPATKIYRFSLKRQGNYLRALAVAVGVSGALFVVSYLQADPFVRIFLHIAAFPLLFLSPLIGLVPERTVEVRGRLNRFIRKKDDLNRYTVETKRQQLQAEPAW